MGGAAKNNFFYALTEKYFGANGLLPGVSGSAIAYFEKNRAPKAREKIFAVIFPEGGFIFPSKQRGVLTNSQKQMGVHISRKNRRGVLPRGGSYLSGFLPGSLV